MHLEHLDATVDLLDESRVSRRAVHRADPARVETTRPIAQVVVEVARLVHRFRLLLPLDLSKPVLDFSLAIRQRSLSKLLLTRNALLVSAFVVFATRTLTRLVGHFE